MKAVVNGHVIADSDDVVDCGGYQYSRLRDPPGVPRRGTDNGFGIWPARMASNSMTW